MTAKIAIITAAENAGATQDFTENNFGDPVAAMWIVTADTALGEGSVNHAVLSVGYTDGTSQVVTNVFHQAGKTTTGYHSRGATDEVVQLITASAVDAEANFDSFITDGVRIAWGVNATSYAGCMVTCILFGDDDTRATVGTFDTSAGNASVSLSFEPSLVICSTIRDALDDTTKNNTKLSIGFCTNDETTVKQMSYNWGVNNSSGQNAYSRLEDANVTRDLTGGTLGGAQQLVSFSATGFTADQINSAGYVTGYLALRFEDQANELKTIIDLVVRDTNTSQTTETISTLGARTGTIFVLPTRQTAVNTTVQGANSGVLTFGCASVGIYPDELSFGQQACHSIHDEHGVSLSNTESVTDSELVRQYDDDGTTTNQQVVRARVGTATGHILDWMEADTTARKMIELSIQQYEPLIYVGSGSFSFSYNANREKDLRFEFDLVDPDDESIKRFYTDLLESSKSGSNVTVTHSASAQALQTTAADDFDLGPFDLYVDLDNNSLRVVDPGSGQKIGSLSL